MRGGVLFTPTGGWRYYCFNGGCEFNIQPCGWEPGNGFGGRPRRVFEMIGGDVRRIPLKEIMRWSKAKFGADGERQQDGQELEVVHKFPEVALPPKSRLLIDAYMEDRFANQVMRYGWKRFGRTFMENFPFFWTPEKYSRYLIMPFYHYQDRIVGYLGRHIDRDSGPRRFIQRAPSDYLYNQHLLASYSARYLFVVESPMDAALLGCVAARNDRLTDKQINLLKVSGKDIVMVPDYKKGEWEGFVQQAHDNGWFVSIPDWPGGKQKAGNLRTTDIGQSVKNNGLLYTIELMMQSTTRNQERIKTFLRQRSV